ncbi:MAG: hypothetical protein KJ767_02240 [Nanoarchaeota archaeon]|nr:hypothetical protein [Nanoarchaeota archaeon]
MKINNETIIFIIYGIVFAYALIAYFTRLLPYGYLAVPVALTLFVIFVIHLANRLFRSNTEK